MVRELRDFGASQGHIARIVGVSVSTVSLWQARRRTPSTRSLDRLLELHRSLIGGTP